MTESPRADIGLDAAHEGEINGLRRFVGFVAEELLGLTITTEWPDGMRERVQSLQGDAARLMHFIDGYSCADRNAKK